MQTIRKKTNFIFYQILAVGIFFLITLIFISTNLYSKLISISHFLFNKLETICGCTQHWSFLMHPFIFSFIILTGLIVVVFAIFSILRILKLSKATNKFVGFNLGKAKRCLSYKLRKESYVIGLENKLIEINASQPVIFCYGLIHPKICISAGLVKKLNSQELVAVLKHEQHHLLSFEPLKIFLTKIISKILFFIPMLKLLTQKYQTLSELAADEYATQGFKNKAPLASALEKVMSLTEQSIIKNNLAISFFAVIDERVNKLIDDQYMPSLKVFHLKSLMFLTVIFMLVISFFIPVYFTESIMVQQMDNSCLANETVPVGTCQMPLVYNNCLMSHVTIENISSYCG